MSKLPKEAVLVHGGCRGADLVASEIWKSQGGACIEVKADWNKHGKAAGPIRNKEMLDKYPISSAIAFRNGITKGTQDMINKLTQRHIKVEEIWM